VGWNLKSLKGLLKNGGQLDNLDLSEMVYVGKVRVIGKPNIGREVKMEQVEKKTKNKNNNKRKGYLIVRLNENKTKPVVSKHFGIDELTHSRTALRRNIDNKQYTQNVYDNAVFLADNVLEKIRLEFNSPVILSSWFRCVTLNNLIGGNKHSYHLKGSAVDIIKGYNKETPKLSVIFEYIKNNLEFDQLIWEHGDKNEPGWIHVGLNRRGKNRKQVLYVGV